jgi:hypothetical protein
MLNKITLSAVRHSKALALPLMLVLLTLVSCKDDETIDPDENPQNTEKALIPEKDQTYTYKITDSEGVESSSVLRVTSVKDSAGIPVYNVQNVINDASGKMTLNYRAFSHNGLTTNELAVPAGLASLEEYVREFAYIEDYELSGFPQVQIFENKGTVNSKVTFSKQPIKMHLDLTIPLPDDERISAKLDCTLQYEEGKVVKEESVTTPAGTFNCSKWEYSYELYTKLTTDQTPPEESTVVYTVLVWTAPGIGVVKSSEVSGTDITNTELQKIAKQ